MEQTLLAESGMPASTLMEPPSRRAPSKKSIEKTTIERSTEKATITSEQWRWVQAPAQSPKTSGQDAADSKGFGVAFDDWERVLASDNVCLIKRSRHRCVVSTPGQEVSPLLSRVICKRQLTCGVRGYLRNVWRGSSARWEAWRIELARSYRISTARLLGFSERRRWGQTAECRLLTEEIPQTQSIADFQPPRQLSVAPSEADAHQRAGWLTAVADLLSQLHANSLWHGDLHTGNILVRQRGEEWDTWLIDLSGLRSAEKLPLSCRLGDLTRLWLSLDRICTAREWATFLRLYWQKLYESRPSTAECLGPCADVAVEFMSAGIEPIRRRVLRRADAHWSRGKSQVTVTAEGRSLTVLGSAWQTDWNDHHQQLWNAATFCHRWSGGESRRIELGTSVGRQTFRLFRFTKNRFPTQIWSPARRAWELGHALHRRGIPVAVPWALKYTAEADYLIACEPPGMTAPTPTASSEEMAFDRQGRDCLADLLRAHGFPITDEDAERFSYSVTQNRWVYCALERLRR